MTSSTMGKAGNEACNFVRLSHAQGDALVEPRIGGVAKDWARQAHSQDCAHVSGSVDLDRRIRNGHLSSLSSGSIVLHLQFDAITPQARKPF